MATVTIDIDRNRLPEHTDEQFEAWVMFCIGERGDISMDNPLWDFDLQATVRRFE